MQRLATLLIVSVFSVAAHGHHWVRDVYDSTQRFIVKVEVRKFQLINPHPLMQVEITDIRGGQLPDGVVLGQTWTLEMDNKRELTALGFHDETFVPGDQILVAVDPLHDTNYRRNTLYMRAVEHQREGFVYLHNVRRLFPVETAGESLSRHLDRIK